MYAVRFHEFTGQVIGASDELERDDIGSAYREVMDEKQREQDNEGQPNVYK